jgi:transcriptional regulator GlxA family with amidase domain
MTKKVGIYLFDDVELLDFAGPYEVFTTCARVARRGGLEAPFDTLAIGPSRSAVTARAGLPILPTHTIDDHPALDVFIVPGGVVDAQLRERHIIDWIARTARSTPLTASVCTGALLLAQAGLLDGRPATTHWEDLDQLRHDYPAVKVRAEGRWIDDGDIVTSAGIAAGIDMSLHLVARLCGRELAVRTARQMDYPWPPPA